MDKFTTKTVKPDEIDLGHLSANELTRILLANEVIADVIRYLSKTNKWRSFTYSDYLDFRQNNIDYVDPERGTIAVGLRTLHRLAQEGFLKFNKLTRRFSVTDKLIYTLRSCVRSHTIRHD